MWKNREKQIIIFLVVLVFFSVGGNAFAALEVAWPRSPLGTELTENTDITGLIKYFYDWGISLGGFAAFIALVIAGVQYLTSAGNAGKMNDALGKIRSAVIGLALLLVSVLILNTINPQLTVLKIPEFTIDSGKWDIELNLKDKLTATMLECTKVKLYGGTNHNTLIETITWPEDNLNPISGGEVKSVEIEGNCQLTLYRLTDYKTNADNPPVVISGNVLDMAAFGETKFRSAKITNLKFE